MAHHSPEQIARQYYDLFNRRLFQQIEMLVSPKAVFYYPHTKDHMIGRAGYRELVRIWLTAFPDARVEVLNLTVEGPTRVRAELLGHGTHTGALAFGGPLTLPASGRRADLALTDTLEVSEGLIVNSWLSFDLAELLRQLT